MEIFRKILACPQNLVQSSWESYNWQRARERPMRKRPRRDQIAAILRDFQADLDAGLNINHACRKAGIGPTT